MRGRLHSQPVAYPGLRLSASVARAGFASARVPPVRLASTPALAAALRAGYAHTHAHRSRRPRPPLTASRCGPQTAGQTIGTAAGPPWVARRDTAPRYTA